MISLFNTQSNIFYTSIKCGGYGLIREMDLNFKNLDKFKKEPLTDINYGIVSQIHLGYMYRLQKFLLGAELFGGRAFNPQWSEQRYNFGGKIALGVLAHQRLCLFIDLGGSLAEIRSLKVMRFDEEQSIFQHGEIRSEILPLQWSPAFHTTLGAHIILSPHISLSLELNWIFHKKRPIPKSLIFSLNKEPDPHKMALINTEKLLSTEQFRNVSALAGLTFFI